MKKVLFRTMTLLFLLTATTNCLKEESVVIEEPIDPVDTIDLGNLPDSLNLADVDPLVGIYVGGVVAFEGDNSFAQSSGYNLQVLKKDDGIIQIKGNFISYNFIILTDEDGVYTPHPSLTYVKEFSWDPETGRLKFIISRPFIYIRFDGILSYG